MNIIPTHEELQEVKKFNRHIEWLKRKELKEGYTASAGEIMKITGWTKDRLKGERERGTIRSKKYGTQFRYDLSSLPEVYKQKIIYAPNEKEQQINSPISNPHHMEEQFSSGNKKGTLNLINPEFFNIYFKTASISF
ncbi:hypothetical protein [Agriterribacter humi]|uniref:hypothetical protein n=1 Tax=Agriterribacter humi TaxID=1104781 RepID=UPI001263F5B9|nr:hypothetical protein [Agriterribacter humi]